MDPTCMPIIDGEKRGLWGQQPFNWEHAKANIASATFRPTSEHGTPVDILVLFVGTQDPHVLLPSKSSTCVKMCNDVLVPYMKRDYRRIVVENGAKRAVYDENFPWYYMYSGGNAYNFRYKGQTLQPTLGNHVTMGQIPPPHGSSPSSLPVDFHSTFYTRPELDERGFIKKLNRRIEVSYKIQPRYEIASIATLFGTVPQLPTNQRRLSELEGDDVRDNLALLEPLLYLGVSPQEFQFDTSAKTNVGGNVKQKIHKATTLDDWQNIANELNDVLLGDEAFVSDYQAAMFIVQNNNIIDTLVIDNQLKMTSAQNTNEVMEVDVSQSQPTTTTVTNVFKPLLGLVDATAGGKPKRRTRKV